MTDILKLSISIPGKKMPVYLGNIETTREELAKHKNQRLTLVLNKLTEYILKNAKRDEVLINYLQNLERAGHTTDDGIKIDILGE